MQFKIRNGKFKETFKKKANSVIEKAMRTLTQFAFQCHRNFEDRRKIELPLVTPVLSSLAQVM